MSDESVELNDKPTEKLLGGITGKGFMPGQSGCPGGRKETLFMRIMKEKLNDPAVAEDLADKVINLWKTGDFNALKPVLDRTDPVKAEIEVTTIDLTKLTPEQLAAAFEIKSALE